METIGRSLSLVCLVSPFLIPCISRTKLFPSHSHIEVIIPRISQIKFFPSSLIPSFLASLEPAKKKTLHLNLDLPFPPPPRRRRRRGGSAAPRSWTWRALSRLETTGRSVLPFVFTSSFFLCCFLVSFPLLFLFCSFSSSLLFLFLSFFVFVVFPATSDDFSWVKWRRDHSTD